MRPHFPELNSHPWDSGGRDADLPSVDDNLERLSAYLDGELSAAESEAIECWLATDAEGQQLYQQLQQLQFGLQHLPAPAPSTQLADRVLDRLEQSPFPRYDLASLAKRCARVAAGLAIAATGWVAWQTTRPPALMISLDSSPVSIPADKPALDESAVAEAYLLSPNNARDAYSILLDDSWN
jgi:hypothetical protein